MINDAELFHGNYDAAKAREYYLRTRKLKGRKAAAAKPIGPGRHAKAVAGGGKPNRSKTKSRRAELLAQKKALEKRLDHLREVLAARVKEAKSLNAESQPKKDEKDKAPETPKDKADRNSDEKGKKLSPSQKSAKAKKAKEAYEKEHPNSLSKDVDILREQIKDIRAKIQKTITDSQAPQHRAGTKQR